MRLAALRDALRAYGSALRNWTGAGDTERHWRRRLADVSLNIVLVLRGSPIGMVSATALDARGERAS